MKIIVKNKRQHHINKIWQNYQNVKRNQNNKNRNNLILRKCKINTFKEENKWKDKNEWKSYKIKKE